MPTGTFLEEAYRTAKRLLPSQVVSRLRHAAASTAGGRLSRPKAWAPGLLERAGLEGLGRHHLAGLDEKALWALHGRIHELDAKAPKDMRPTLELAHARIAEAMGSKHTLVHDLDFSGRSPHDLEDLTKDEYVGVATKGLTPEQLLSAHASLHRAWTIKTGGYPKEAPPLHQGLPHAAWLAHGHAKGIVSGAAGAEGWHAVVSRDPRGNVHKVYGLLNLSPSRPLSWEEFRALRGDHKVSKRTAKQRFPGLSGFHYRECQGCLPLVEPRPYVKHRGLVSIVGKGDVAANTFAEPFGPLQDHHAGFIVRAHKAVWAAMKREQCCPEGADFLTEIHDAGPADRFPPYVPPPEENIDVMGQPVGSDFMVPGARGSNVLPVEHPLRDPEASDPSGRHPAIDRFNLPEPGAPPFGRTRKAGLDETPGLFRYRLHDPDGYARVRTIHGQGVAAGLQMLVGVPANGGGSEIISLHFPKPKWEEGKVRAWLRDHLASFRKGLNGPSMGEVHVNKPMGAFRYVLPSGRPAGGFVRPANLKKASLPPEHARLAPRHPEYLVHMGRTFAPGRLMDHPRALHYVAPAALPGDKADQWAKTGHNIQGKMMWVLPHAEEGKFKEFRRLYHETRVGDSHVFTNYDPAKERSEGGDIRKDVVFLHKAMDQQIVVGVVMEPHAVDTQGDFTTPDVIEQTAHTWLAHYRIIGEQHGKVARSTEVAESYIAPQDMKLGGQTVPKGSWVLAVHVNDASLWKDIRAGKYTGFSIGGYGQSQPVKESDLLRLKRRMA